MSKKRIHVGLLVCEFFGAAGTGYGGYGFLARYLVAKYLPRYDIELDVILGKNRRGFLSHFKARREDVWTDGFCTRLYMVPRRRFFLLRWLKKMRYDAFLSIELSDASVARYCNELAIPLVFWIQDPRPWYEWREIETMKLLPEFNYYQQRIYDHVNQLSRKGLVTFVSQAECLIDKARDLYRLSSDVQIDLLRNPVEVDVDFDLSACEKKDQILFLGRLESVKRGWLFCEIAKLLPQYQFVVCGQTFRDASKNKALFDQYAKMPNLKFAGRVEGAEKIKYLMESKILVNTSIHEALPVSFLEAMAYGTCIVSNRNPDSLAEKFGVYVGDALGDGFDSVPRYVKGIVDLMSDDALRDKKARAAIQYVREFHLASQIFPQLREVIDAAIAKNQGRQRNPRNVVSVFKRFLMEEF